MERCHTQRFHPSAGRGERGLHLHMGLCQRPNIAKRVLVVDNGFLLSGIRKLAVIPCYSPQTAHIYQTALNERIQRYASKSNPKKHMLASKPTIVDCTTAQDGTYRIQMGILKIVQSNSPGSTCDHSFIHTEIIRLPADATSALLAYLHIP